MKKLLLFVIAICVQTLCDAQGTPIDSSAYGNNANLTDTVGIDNHTGGKLEQFWIPGNPNNFILDSRLYFMRYGGILVEQKCLIDGNPKQGFPFPSHLYLTIADYVRKAIAMQKNGITPMLTLPLNAVFGNNFPSAAHQAALLVKNVNDSLKSLGRTCVFHWVYSNEPEAGGIHFYDDSLAGKKIHDYIQAYHDSVSFVWSGTWGGSPNFIGPELYSFDNYPHGGTNKVNRLIEQLCGKYNQLGGPVNAFDIRPYLTEFSWHYYPFNTEADTTIGIPTPTDSNLVDVLATGVRRWGIPGNSNPLQKDLDSLKSWLGSSGVKMAITEANVCHENDVNPTDWYHVTNDSIRGNGANSYRGAMLYTELMSICMKNNVRLNMWSGLEGDSANNYLTNVGYLNSDKSKFGGVGGEKPLWHLFKMCSDNFHGNFHGGTYSQMGAGDPVNFARGIKTFASVEAAGIKVMIMNYNDSAYKFRINFASGVPAVGPDTVKLDFPFIAGDPKISGTINLNHHYYPTSTDTGYSPIAGRSTALLTFDCNGILQSRQNYSEADAAINKPPHFSQIGNINVDGSALNQSVINCGHPGIGGTINSNTTYSNTTVYVNSNILITGHSELTFVNCLVVMAAGTKIKANPNCSIVLNKSIMVGCGGINTWKGLELNGNYQAGERLKIDSSYIFNATNPVYADKIGNMHINKSVFGNGQTAIELNRSEAFSITENIIVGYNIGIKTSNTKPNFVSEIKDNRIIETQTAIQFANDNHNLLDVFCNDFLYRQKGIASSSTDLKIQGTSSMSAGNRFIKLTPGVPLAYIDHSGTPTQYYYGPSETAEFSLPTIVNIPIVMAAADRVCNIAFSAVCPSWMVGIEEHTIKSLSPNMLIYPNPSQGAFTVNFSSLPKDKNWTLSVYDVMGKLISARKVDTNLESTTLQINAKGIYFVTLQNGNNRVSQKVIVE